MGSRSASLTFMLVLALALWGCGEDRSHLTEGQDLGLHCSATSEEIRQRLGEPTKEIKGLGGYDKDVRDDGVDMGISSMIYKDLGLSFSLRHDETYQISVTRKYKGSFHGFAIGAQISEIVDSRGLPYGDTATPERAIQVDLSRDDWVQTGGTDRWAYYLVDASPTHHISFYLDQEGVVHGIAETDNDIRGGWFVMPRH